MKSLLTSLALIISITLFAQDIETGTLKIVDANGVIIGSLNKSLNSNDFIIGSLTNVDIQSLVGAIEFKTDLPESLRGQTGLEAIHNRGFEA